MLPPALPRFQVYRLASKIQTTDVSSCCHDGSVMESWLRNPCKHSRYNNEEFGEWAKLRGKGFLGKWIEVTCPICELWLIPSYASEQVLGEWHMLWLPRLKSCKVVQGAVVTMSVRKQEEKWLKCWYGRQNHIHDYYCRIGVLNSCLKGDKNIWNWLRWTNLTL